MEKRFRERLGNSFTRRAPTRSPRDIILIVCEGEKTEPSYFKQLKNKWRLHPTHIEIVGKECDSDPKKVVDYAIKRRDERQRSANKGGNPAFDQVWCVFDHEGKNKHKTYDEAIEKAKAHNLKVAFSVPSFELWFLLHYEYTNKEFSTCDEVIKEIKKKKYIHDYNKSQIPFEQLYKLLDNALKNTDLLRNYNERSRDIKNKREDDNPATDVDLLVKELKRLTE